MEGDEVEVPIEGERQSFEVILLKTIHQEKG
jgi:hypothetical protein